MPVIMQIIFFLLFLLFLFSVIIFGIILAQQGLAKNKQKRKSFVILISSFLGASLFGFTFPFAINKGKSIYGFSLLFELLVYGGIIQSIMGIIVVIGYKSTNNRKLLLIAGGIFISISMLLVLWFTIGDETIKFFDIHAYN